MRPALLWSAAVAVLLGAGCAGVPRAPGVTDARAAWVAHRAQLEALDGWELTGRLAVRSERRRGGQATLIWARAAQHHEIEMYGPFGGGRVRLTQDPGGAELHDTRNRHYTGPNAQDVLYRAAGWHVPFNALAYWVAGLPAPGPVELLELDADGRLQTLRQAGWEVQFLEYRTADGYQLPRRIDARALPGTASTGAPAEVGSDIHVRLVIRRWDV